VGGKSNDGLGPYQWHSDAFTSITEGKVANESSVSGRDRFHACHVAAELGTYDFY